MFSWSSKNHIRYFYNEHYDESDEDNRVFAAMPTIDESKEVEDERKTIDNIKSPPIQVLNKDDIFWLDSNPLNEEKFETIDELNSIKLPRDTPTTPINDPSDFIKFSSNSEILQPSYPELKKDSCTQDIINTSEINNEKVQSFSTEEISHPKSSLTITNIVFSLNLNCKINLAEACKLCDNWRYHPSKFSGMILSIKKPKATATNLN